MPTALKESVATGRFLGSRPVETGPTGVVRASEAQGLAAAFCQTPRSSSDAF